MIKRTSLVWKRPELSLEEFRRRWLGKHVECVRRLPGVREYVIDFVRDGPAEGPHALATLRFDSREALDAAFGDPQLSADLMRTRETFAASVQVVIVDEHVVVGAASKDDTHESRSA
jgi:uncharacterized protein (TIGR02118 family)